MPDKDAAINDEFEDQIMADDANMHAHVATYDKVIGMMKWGSVGVAIIAAVVIWLIS